MSERRGAPVDIRNVEFVGAVAQPGASPPLELPQIAFAGRSNVGKSSLINRALGRTRTHVARISSRPGKTREINFYRVSARLQGGRDTDFLLVDLPGYGYANVPLAVRESWRPLIESYLSNSPSLRGVVHILDARHAPTREDTRMVHYLSERGTPTLFAITKIDKLKRGQRPERVRSITEALGLSEDQVLAFSSRTGEGREDLLASLDALLRPATDEARA